MDYRLSIVIPTIGWNKHFDQAVSSAISHSPAGTEVIVSMNGCELQDFRQSEHFENNDILWLRASGERLDLHESWNRAVSFASNPWVFLLSDDDMILPGFLDDPEAQLVQSDSLYYARPLLIDDFGNTISEGKAPNLNLLRGETIKQALLSERFLNHASSFIFPKKLWSEIGGYEAVGYPNGYYVDTVFHIKLLARVKKVIVDHRPLISRRFTPRQISAEFLVGSKVGSYLRSVVVSLWSDQTSKELIGDFYGTRRRHLIHLSAFRFFLEWQKSLNPIYEAKRSLRVRLFCYSMLSWPLGIKMRIWIVKSLLLRQLSKSDLDKWFLFRADPTQLLPKFRRDVGHLMNMEARLASEIKNHQTLLQSDKVLREYLAYSKKSCFVIGNGPSLKAEDLDLIRGFDSFGANKIHLIYPKTNWRPTFLSIVDEFAVEEYMDDSHEYGSYRVFTSSNRARAFQQPGKFCFVRHLDDGRFHQGGYRFSKDALTGLYSSLTVTLFNIQLAAFMGYERIVLLGVDHSYEGEPTTEPGVPKIDAVNHFDASYRAPGRKVGAVGIEQMRWGYVHAERAAREYGIEIIDATRNGRLDVFPKLELEDLVGDLKRESK